MLYRLRTQKILQVKINIRKCSLIVLQDVKLLKLGLRCRIILSSHFCRIRWFQVKKVDDAEAFSSSFFSIAASISERVMKTVGFWSYQLVLLQLRGYRHHRCGPLHKLISHQLATWWSKHRNLVHLDIGKQLEDLLLSLLQCHEGGQELCNIGLTLRRMSFLVTKQLLRGLSLGPQSLLQHHYYSFVSPS